MLEVFAGIQAAAMVVAAYYTARPRAERPTTVIRAKRPRRS